MAYTSEIEKLERRVQENPQGRFFASLADAYRKDGQIARALDVVKAGLVIHPDYVSARVVLGRCYMDQGDDAAAQEAFSRVAELDGESVIALKALADISERQGDFAAAAKWAQQLLTVDPGSDEARDQLSRVQAQAAVPDPAPAVAEAPSPFLDLAEPAAPAAETVATSEPVAPAVEPEPVVAPTPTLALEVEPRRDAIRFEPSSETEPRTLELMPTEPEPFRSSKRMSGVELTSMAAEAPEPVAPALGLEATAPMEAISDSAIDGFEVTSFDGAADARDASDDVVREDTILEAAESETIERGVAGEDTIFEAAESEMIEREEDFGLTAGDASEYQQPDASVSLVPGAGSSEYQTPSAVDSLTLVDESDDAPPTGFHEPLTDEPPSGEPEPEPVVTEAMAILYASQGHLREALAVYRELLDRSPADTRLAAKVAELEGTAAPAAPRSWRAAETGGRSVGSWLTAVTGARLPEVTLPAGSAPEMAIDTPRASSAVDTGMDESPPSGAPTQPAHDSMSLSAIFGDEPAAPPVHGPGAGSFDDFFGASPSAAAATAAPRPRSIRQVQPDDADLSQFQDWLKNLKK
ncbi:MAG: tetratricopeptide repeat protein [Gemmatimonadales bacterium]